MKKINLYELNEIKNHFNKLSLKNRIKGLNYERCAELPFILEILRPFFNENLKYLDIGSGGESPLPSYLLNNTNWQINCIDKFDWIKKQSSHVKKNKIRNDIDRFNIYTQDILDTNWERETFDVITNISVIEHFEGEKDIEAMKLSGLLLKKGGIYILTTLINDGYFKEFYVDSDVYGEKYDSKKVFYQRHYDAKNVSDRLIKPSGLNEKERCYFGEYDYQFFEKHLQLRKVLKPLKILYSWATPIFAQKFISYRDEPVSRPDMKMNTSSGIILILSK